MATNRPKLKFLRGSTYTFDVSNADLATHPFKFTADSGSTEYTTGVTLTGTQGQSGAEISFVVPNNAPQNLNYYCGTHGMGMGNHIFIPPLSILPDSDGSFLASPYRSHYNVTAASGTLYTSGSGTVYFMTVDEGVPASNDSDGTFFTDSDVEVSIDSDYLYGGGHGNVFNIVKKVAGWNGDRAVAFDGTNGLSDGYRNIIDYFDITTLGDATDFGDPEQGQYTDGVVSNGSRIVYGRHGATVDGGAGAPHDELSYVTSSTPGNAAAFGTLTYLKSNMGSGSNGTYGLFSGGFYSGGVTTIDYITIDTIGNGSSFGNLTLPGSGRGSSGNTYMLHVYDIDHTGGSVTRTNAIDRMTIGTSGSASDFGDQVNILSNKAVTEDTTRVVIAGGRANGNPDYYLRDFIEYVTVDTPGNASSFGTLILKKHEFGGVSNSTRGVFCGGQKHSDNANPGNSYAVHDDLEYITIQTLGNAQAFGNLTSARNKLDAGSGAAA